MNASISIILLLLACSTRPSPDNENNGPNFSETAHFRLSWDSTETTPQEIEKAKSFCEEIYNKLAVLIGEEKMPANKISITFNGDGVRPGRAKTPPYVDAQGRIHLYRFRQGGYFDAFPHELVHAIRINRIPNWEPFFEEGFASAISNKIYQKTGFPLFGYGRSKIAAYLMYRDDFIPLKELRSRHSQLNLQCQLQSYISREDFFCYLGSTYGIGKLIEFSNSTQTSETSLYRQVWGKEFGELAKEWKAHTMNLHDREDALKTGKDYLKKTAAKYIPICDGR